MAELTTKARQKLPKSAFAIPEDEAYPIHDEAHARNALARVKQHGTPDEQRRVIAAVRRRYAGIDVETKAPKKAADGAMLFSGRQPYDVIDDVVKGSN